MKIDSDVGQIVMATGAASVFGALTARELAAMTARRMPGDLRAGDPERVTAPACAKEQSCLTGQAAVVDGGVFAC